MINLQLSWHCDVHCINILKFSKCGLRVKLYIQYKSSIKICHEDNRKILKMLVGIQINNSLFFNVGKRYMLYLKILINCWVNPIFAATLTCFEALYVLHIARQFLKFSKGKQEQHIKNYEALFLWLI